MADLSKLVSASTTEVNNSSGTNITNPLDRATAFQMYVVPSDTAQIFTITLPDSRSNCPSVIKVELDAAETANASAATVIEDRFSK